MKYSDSTFVQSYVVKQEFHSTSDSKQKMKKRKVLGRYLLFCPEPLCSVTFEEEESLERHLLSENHEYATRSSPMDKVKSSFIHKMKVSSSLHQINANTNVKVFDSDLFTLCEEVKLMSIISNQGWAIPTRTTFRYTPAQKKFLYDIFLTGEETGKKKSPEEVERLVRQKFKSTDLYVTVPQIRALFSSFSRKYREGTLKNPEEEAENPVDSNDTTMVIEPDEDQIDGLLDTIDKALSSLSTWEIRSWVVVKYGRQWYPGRILQHNEGEDEYSVTCMMRKQHNSNCFRWPESTDIEIYDPDDILLQIDEVTPIDS